VDTTNGSDNYTFDSNKICPQGGYAPNGRLFMVSEENQDGIMMSAISDHYSRLFEFQRRSYDTHTYQQAISKLKVTHPFVKTIYDRHLFYCNKKKGPRNFGFNTFLKKSTTWKYPPTVHDDMYDFNHEDQPDRKVLMIVIITPVFGGKISPGQDMHGVDDVEEAFEDGKKIQVKYVREGSIVADEFGDPPEKVKEEPDTDVLPSGPSRSTRSKSKAVALDPDDPNPSDSNEKENEEVANMLEALTKNRHNAREEARLRKEALKVEPDPFGPPIVNQYGWALNQTIMIRPTIELFYKDLTTGRFNR
jgi:hypothetical protein